MTISDYFAIGFVGLCVLVIASVLVTGQQTFQPKKEVEIDVFNLRLYGRGMKAWIVLTWLALFMLTPFFVLFLFIREVT